MNQKFHLDDGALEYLFYIATATAIITNAAAQHHSSPAAGHAHRRPLLLPCLREGRLPSVQYLNDGRGGEAVCCVQPVPLGMKGKPGRGVSEILRQRRLPYCHRRRRVGGGCSCRRPPPVPDAFPLCVAVRPSPSVPPRGDLAFVVVWQQQLPLGRRAPVPPPLCRRGPLLGVRSSAARPRRAPASCFVRGWAGERTADQPRSNHCCLVQRGEEEPGEGRGCCCRCCVV